MQRKFITNLALLLFLNLLIKPFWILGIDRAVQNAVGTEDYGIYFALFNFTFLFNILLDVGITNFNNKNIAQNNHLLTKHFSSLLVLKFVLAAVYFVVLLIVGIIVGYTTSQLWLLVLLGINQFLAFFVLYLRSNLAGLHLFKTDSILSVLDRALMIAMCAVLLWGNITGGEFRIELFIYAQTLSVLITAIIAFMIVLSKTEFLKLRWNTTFFKMILKQSFPFAVLVLLMTFYNRVDTVMMERMLIDGAEQSGIYAQAYRLLDSSNMIAYLFSVLLLPIFAKMLKLNESIEQLVKLSFSLIIVPAIIVAVSSFFYSYELMEILYKEHVYESSRIFGTLMTCFVAISTTYIFGTLLTANGNLKELNLMAGFGMLINIVLNLILIPKYKVIGAASASLITQSVMALTQVLIVVKIFHFRINYRLLIILVIFIAGSIIMAFCSRFLPFNWVFNFILMIISSISLAFLTRLISIKAIYRILKYG